MHICSYLWSIKLKRQRELKKKEREEALEAEFAKAEAFTKETLAGLNKMRKEEEDRFKKELDEKAIAEEARREAEAKKAAEDLVLFKKKKEDDRDYVSTASNFWQF